MVFSNIALAEELDKIIAVFNNNVLTKSEAARAIKNIPAKKNIAPYLFKKDKFYQKDIIEYFFNKYSIRSKLQSLGYKIEKPQVEAQVNGMATRLNLSKEDLLKFLEQNNLNYSEYFELTKESIEYNIFVSKIISPLIKVTDQEMKNLFIQKYKKKNISTYNLNLVNFSIAKSALTKQQKKNLVNDLLQFQKNGILPPHLKGIQTNLIEDVKEEGLNNKFQESVKGVPENNFSKLVLLADNYHIFFIKKRQVIDSNEFLQAKQALYREIFDQKSASVITSWLKKEREKHFSKTF